MVPFLLVIVPLVVAILLLCIKDNGVRKLIVKLAALALIVLSVALGVQQLNQPAILDGSALSCLPSIVLVVDVVTALAIFYYTLQHRRYSIALLELLQVGLVVYFDLTEGHGIKSAAPFLIDNFAIIMVLIAGIVGSLIAVFSLGYMEEFQKEHPDVADRRPFFFFVVFLFLAAMFGLVMSNNLLYMYTCWEITSFSSFLLIGYTQTEEATNNSFKALWMNLLGGLAFAIAIVWMGCQFHTVELTAFLGLANSSKAVEMITALLVFCGFTKAAMMPFSGWLLGAMVAPTPTSALLHSSTMVKAGVFLIIKLSPMLGANYAGMMAMLVGGLTFFFASCAAISQSDGKKVLAYSTISNLGLIVCCSGVGTYATAWAAIMLVICHAVAKSLSFLSVGTAEQQLGSRNIEYFDGMFCNMPGLALCMLVGICGMFLAPFGMLVSKWAAMKSVVDAGQPLLVLLLVFGSSTTMFYWCKWLGKICAYIPTTEKLEEGIHGVQWLALRSLATLTVVVTVAFPFISKLAVAPYLNAFYHSNAEVIAETNMWLMSIIVLFMLVLSLRFGKGGESRKVLTQLSGQNTGDNSAFYGSAGTTVPVTLRNWYLEEWFGERRMLLGGFSLCIACMLIAFSLICGGVFHV